MSDAISFINGTDGGVRSAGKKSKEKSRKKEEEIIPFIFFFFSQYLVISKSLYSSIYCVTPQL